MIIILSRREVTASWLQSLIEPWKPLATDLIELLPRNIEGFIGLLCFKSGFPLLMNMKRCPEILQTHLKRTAWCPWRHGLAQKSLAPNFTSV